jgi:hypothetical protein
LGLNPQLLISAEAPADGVVVGKSRNAKGMCQ